MQLGIGLVIVLVLVALAGGVALGMFLARKHVSK